MGSRRREHWTLAAGVLALVGAGAACGVPLATPSTSAVPGDVSVNSIGMRLVRIPAGEFLMGSDTDEPGHVANEGPLHRVRLTQFDVGVTEVTNGQFAAFVAATGYRTEAERDVSGGFGIDFATARVRQDPDHDWRSPGFPEFEPGPDHPVLMISWSDAEAFCRWLSEKEGRAYRLPTEAEWEYAARGGTRTSWWPGDDAAALVAVGNTADASLRAAMPPADWASDWDDGHRFTAPVGSFRANPFGLHDVHGNVWEWCADWYRSDYYARSPAEAPPGPDRGRFRAIRGGGWFNGALQNRSAQRIYFVPTFRYCLLSGFRVVREVE